MSHLPSTPRPNVLIVVMDCVRADVFPGSQTDLVGMPFVDQLRRQSITFPRAATTAPWTVPAHASLFTGLYPWEHGAHARGSFKLDPSKPTLAEAYSATGYATAAFSANGFVGPAMGLVRGFGASAWGSWWERYLRVPDLQRPFFGQNLEVSDRGPRGRAWDRIAREVHLSHRFPFAWDVVNRVVGKVRYPEDGPMLPVSSWIEPTLRRWLEAQSPTTPAFCFVNLMDAHEPYLTNPEIVGNLHTWLDYARVRGDWTSLIAGEWTVDPTASRRIGDLYRGMLGVLDGRVQRITEIFRELGRWDNTLMVLTSDHGQALGEHGYMFHSAEVWEPLMRIPLLLRLQAGTLGGTEARGWASLVDLAPTLTEISGVPGLPSQAGQDLRGLVDRPRRGPVVAMGDGITEKDLLKRIGVGSSLGSRDQAKAVAYENGWKIVVNVDSAETNAYHLDTDPGETAQVWPVPTEVLPLIDRARDLAVILSREGAGKPSREIDHRLRSWGY